MMSAGNMRHVLPELSDKCDSEDPFSFKLYPSNSLNEEDSVAYFKNNNRIQFKEDFFDLHVTLPFEVVIYTKEEKWQVGRTGFVHIGTNANIVQAREPDGDKLKLSKIKVAIKNIKFYDPEAESEEEKEMTNEEELSKGVANLQIKNNLKKEMDVKLNKGKKHDKFDPKFFTVKVQDGFLVASYSDKSQDIYANIVPKKFRTENKNFQSTINAISLGLKDAHEKRLKEGLYVPKAKHVETKEEL
jgi:hypothetical protein